MMNIILTLVILKLTEVQSKSVSGLSLPAMSLTVNAITGLYKFYYLNNIILSNIKGQYKQNSKVQSVLLDDSLHFMTLILAMCLHVIRKQRYYIFVTVVKPKLLQRYVREFNCFV